MKTAGRLLSLDVLRGITIAGMILVNNPGTWEYVYAPLKHAQWNGLTPTDLVFPFFMFIMGVSMYISLKKYNWELNRECTWKILKRSLLIFLVGYGLNWFGFSLNRFISTADLPLWERMMGSFFNFSEIRVFGVMQRLSLAYCFGSLIGCLIKKPRNIPVVAGGILLIYWIILILGNGFSFSENNIIAVIDHGLVGEQRMYHDTNPEGLRIAFDPEGLLSALGSIGHVLLGFFCGYLILNSKKDNEKAMQSLFLFGTVLLFTGLLLNYGCPVNKKIWSPSFALATCGFASLLLALLIWIIDIKGYKKWSVFFESFGINPLFLFVAGSLLGTIFRVTGLKPFVYGTLLQPYLGNYLSSLIYALLYVCFVWAIGYPLYKKQIYIKL